MPLRPALLAAVLALAPAAGAATIVVDSGTDDGAGCTLREAVEAANTDAAVGGCPAGSGLDVIRFSVPTVALSEGQLVLTADVRLVGPVTLTSAPATALRLVSVASGVTARFVNVTFTEGRRGAGGALFVGENARVEVSGGAFRNNTAPNGGGGGAAWVVGTLVLDRVSLTDNKSLDASPWGGGGAVFVAGGRLEARRSTFERNRATEGGGAIGVAFGGTLSDLLSTFEGNAADRGGAIAVASGEAGSVALEQTTFGGHRAGDDAYGRGGTLYLGPGATATMTGGRIERSRALQGGGVWVGPGATFLADGVRFDRSRALPTDGNALGGAVFVAGAFEARGGTSFRSGDATFGGGVHVKAGGSLTATGVAFVGNRAERGGALNVLANDPGAPVDVSLTDVEVRGNQARDGQGAGLRFTGDALTATVTGGLVTRNRVAFVDAGTGGQGAGLYVQGDADVTLTDVPFTYNIVRVGRGGGVYSEGARLVVEGGRFFRNHGARGDFGPEGLGGAAYVTGGTAAFRGTRFEANDGADGAGALFAGDGAVVAVTDGAAFVGNASGTDGGGRDETEGGAVVVTTGARVEVADALFTDNYADGDGGALFVGYSTVLDKRADQGTLVVTRSTIRGNRAFDGAGIAVGQAGVLELTESLVAENRAQDVGGGVVLLPRPLGQPPETPPAATVVNTTVHTNRASRGGGAAVDSGSLTLEGATVAGNGAAIGGGLDAAGGTSVVLRTTIVADNVASTAGPDLAGSVASDGYNLIGSTPPATVFTPEPTDRVGTDPQLLPLADNGGPTWTMGLEADSPAIDAGAPGLDVDQRGFARDAQPDVGAFEFGAGPSAAPPAAGLEAPAPGLDVFPNPAAGRATVRLTVEATQRVTVSAYDVTGRRALTLFDGVLEGGLEARIPVEASGLAAGVYVVVAEGETVRASTRLSVVR